MIRQVYSIAHNTFVESIRQPIYLVLLMVALLFMTFEPMLAAYTLEDDRKLLLDMGISTLLIAGLLLAAFTATNVLSSEVENKTVLTVVSKPISRPMFVIGKYLGVAAAMTVAYWILAIALLLAFRHGVMMTARQRVDQPVVVFAAVGMFLTVLIATLGNYFYNWVFTSSFIRTLLGFATLVWIVVMLIGKDWSFQAFNTDLEPQMLVGIFLVYQGILVLTAIAIATSTRLGQIMTLVVCVGVFALGINTDYFFHDAAEHSFLAQVAYTLIPNFNLFSPADALTQGYFFTGKVVALTTAYTLFYVTALIALAIALFQNREVG